MIDKTPAEFALDFTVTMLIFALVFGAAVVVIHFVALFIEYLWRGSRD